MSTHALLQLVSETAEANQRLRRALLDCPRRRRRIDPTPFRTLDAPGLGDNFYLSLLDWSAQGEVAVALGRAVYLYDAQSLSTRPLLQQAEGEPEITSLAWEQRGERLAVGFSDGRVELWDTKAERLLRVVAEHRARVGCAVWRGSLLVTGSKDRSATLCDVRARRGGARLVEHKQEVCGLAWSPFDGAQLATGGNDNELVVWDLSTRTVVKKYSEHRAAVKAIDWSPHKPGLLASGGGSNDNSVRFWNAKEGGVRSIGRIDCKSQVCSLRWSRNSTEFVTTHGYPKNWIKVFDYDEKICRLAKFSDHSGRILHQAMSPDGTTIVTGSADETLKFWKIFPEKSKSKLPAVCPRSELRLRELR